MAISKSKIRLLKSRPLCIICAKPQEVQIVARTLQITKDHISSSDIPELGDGYDFYLGTFNIISKDGGEARSLEYYVTSPYRQGIQTFSIQAGTLFHVLRPQFAVHAGVCAGYAKEGIKLEDVIFGDMAINYEEGKWVVEKGQKLFKPSYRTIECRTVASIVGFTQSSLEPTYKYGGYISGSAVREDANEIFDLLRTSVSRDICALEMEASAFLMLCKHHKNIKCLGVVKGVSDLGDSNKAHDPDTYKRSLQVTASAVREWAIYALRNVEWNTDEDDSIVAEFVNIYYENFVRIALDAVGSKQDLTIANDNQRKVQSKDVKGMKVVMPENDDPSAYSESGHIAKIANDHGLESVTIGQSNLGRGLFYKDGYLIDFPRLLNKFAHEDRIQQAKIFQKLLIRKPYFTVSSAESTPLAATATWEDFVKFAPTAPN
ncbi:hypothetical protein G647_01848 [Aspergillus niger]|uniref:Nucleoside phosphorylase domain-containing protein n=1 Tax=Aspergillus niger TaxID=5061 RepID=A0A100ITZ5_ASPNG|nr:hypothetical protein G647_01848 [Aspergillus niger]